MVMEIKLPTKMKVFFSVCYSKTDRAHVVFKKEKNMELQIYDCVLCHLVTEESLMHLFFSRPFSMSCWKSLGLAPLILDDLFQTISTFRAYL